MSNFSIPSGPVAGDPDNGDDFDVKDAVLFAADIVGKLDYVIVNPVFGVAY